MEQYPTFQVDVGRLLCGTVREYLQMEKWKGVDVRWREGKGVFSRIFIVAAPQEDLEVLKADIYRLNND